MICICCNTCIIVHFLIFKTSIHIFLTVVILLDFSLSSVFMVEVYEIQQSVYFQVIVCVLKC